MEKLLSISPIEFACAQNHAAVLYRAIHNESVPDRSEACAICEYLHQCPYILQMDASEISSLEKSEESVAECNELQFMHTVSMGWLFEGFNLNKYIREAL